MNETYEVRPCVTDGAQGVEECQGDDIPGFWGVYLRTTTAEWVADFLHEDDARAYADMKNGGGGGMHEVIFDIGRTLGDHKLCRDGDSRDDFQDACGWAAEFEAAFQSNPDAADTYYEDIEEFAVWKAVEAGFEPVGTTLLPKDES